MARAGMALRRGTAQGNTEGNDDVQRSIELLDRVLSEFDDVENANQMPNGEEADFALPQSHQVSSNTTPGNVSSTPDDESPSLGHQSEDDGYMSMNGRKPKFALTFKPLTEENCLVTQAHIATGDIHDFPPPPEEAERLISTLLPKVSPVKQRSTTKKRTREFPLTRPMQRIETIPPPLKFQNKNIINGAFEPKHIATQTTLPKTRHQRPYGWENTEFNLQPPPHPPNFRYGSLPFPHGPFALPSPTRVPPRTIPTAIERHREVRRHGSEDNLSSDLEETALRPLSELADDEHFSDDSLEEVLPPPPPVINKRSSIAWEVSLDSDDPLLTPGSTKVVGRRRRKSGSHSSTSSIPNRIKDLDDWPDPPPCSTEEEIASPFSDSDEQILLPSEFGSGNLSGSGTYVIRRGKDRKSLLYMGSSVNSNSSLNSRLSSDLSIPHSRLSADLNSRLSRELQTPNSRYSIDLSTPHSRLSQELNSPKSRYSLDLNNSTRLSQELISSPSRLSADLSSSRSSTPQSKYSNDFKKHSTTFDNIKSLIREGVIESCSGPPIESTADFSSPSSPLVRVVSLPALSTEELTPRRELTVTVEEEEDTESPHNNSSDVSPLRKIEQSISELLERRDIEVSSVLKDDRCVIQVNGAAPFNERRKNAPCKPVRESKQKYNDLQKSSSHNEIQRSEEYYRQLLIEGGSVQHYPKRNGIQKSESAKEMLIAHREREARISNSSSGDFPVRVEVLQHEFPPLPPSPVEEDEDEYSEIGQTISQKNRSETLPPSGEVPIVPPHREPLSNSLKTRSMDAGYNRGRRHNFMNNSNRNIPPERRTLPTELQGPKRCTYQKRTSQSSREEHHLQTSCSLPETPIFARGCDIPRTPHRRAPDVPNSHTGPRQSSTMTNLNTLGNVSTGGYRRNSGLEQALVGAELLRMAGGPGRGWYPKQRHPRPASIEHLDRLSTGRNPWDSSRKPLTLPPNLTPKFFQRSPRDALRRVTSLLIRKGNNGKETKKEGTPQKQQEPVVNGEELQKKKGFFKNFWKKSRHYSLEQH